MMSQDLLSENTKEQVKPGVAVSVKKNSAPVSVGDGKNLTEYLNKAKEKLAEACGTLFTPEKVIKVCATLVAQNEKLRECTAESFYTALISSLNVGVLPFMGRAYLIPYRNSQKGVTECQFMLGYQGMLDLAARHGITARAYAIFEGDTFDWTVDDDEKIRYKADLTVPRDKDHLLAVFCRVKSKDEVTYEVMTRSEIEAVRRSSKAGNSGPWSEHYVEMAKKTVIRRAAKYWPLALDTALELEKDKDYEGTAQSVSSDQRAIEILKSKV